MNALNIDVSEWRRGRLAMLARFTAIALLAVTSVLGKDLGKRQWPQFRGPAGAGIGQGDFPIHFGPDTNLVWQTSLPEGNSSPCIWGDRIFVTGFAGGQLTTFCLDRRDGRVLWRGEVPPHKIERGARLGNPATPSPVTDGLRVYVYFGPFGLVCYDFDGMEVWRKPLPVPVTQHGTGTSPVLAGNRLLLVCDQDVGSYLLAVQKHTGRTLWETPRPEFRRGFATPLLWPSKNPELAIIAGTLQLAAYRISDGTEAWRVRGLPNETVASPIEGDGLIYAAGWTPGAGVNHLPSFDFLIERGDRDGDGQLTRDEATSGPAKQHFIYIDADKDGRMTRAEWESIATIFGRSENAVMAVRPGGRGDVTETHVQWKQTRGLPYCPSPLYYEGRIYLVKNGGLLSCFDAKTGEPFYMEERVGALGDYYASPVAAGGKVCVISHPGTAVVLKSSSSLEILARNSLGASVVATPAIVNDTIYIRTAAGLFAFSQTEGSPEINRALQSVSGGR